MNFLKYGVFYGKSLIMNPILSIKPLGFPWETQDPFLFCVHHLDEYPAGNEEMGVPQAALAGRRIGNDFVVKDGWRMYHGQKVPGFPFHPHRGFETITINKQGYVDHSDSLGAASRFGEGDVQWMTAGKGVLHSEMFPLVHQDRDNTLEIFQIWLNLPKRSKFVEPHFKMLWKEMVPVVESVDEAGKKTVIDLVAGTMGEAQAPAPTPDSWAAEPDHQVAVWTIKMEAGAKWTLPAASDSVHRTLYFYRGKNLGIDGQDIYSDHLVQLDPSASISIQSGDEPVSLLLLQGKPIAEPVVQHGPFVMNTRQEIQEAFNDYQQTQFGGWPWPAHEMVHDRSRGRFAIHGDGKEEVK